MLGMRKDGLESAILSTILLRRSHEPPAVAQQFCLPQLGRETVERRCAEGGEDGPDKPNACTGARNAPRHMRFWAEK
jgi:hypothetical protein